MYLDTDSIGFWPIVSVSADSQISTIGRPLVQARIMHPSNIVSTLLWGVSTLINIYMISKIKDKKFKKKNYPPRVKAHQSSIIIVEIQHSNHD